MKIVPIVLLAALLSAGQPRITNAVIHNKAVTGSLEAEFRDLVSKQQQPAWIGYAVPARPGEHRSCCFYSNNGTTWAGCYLEGMSRDTTIPPAQQQPGPVFLEGSRTSHVLFRVENGVVTKINSFSGDCELEGGNLPFFWLTDVKPEESLKLLAGYVNATEEKNRFRESAVTAMAQHSGASKPLIELVRTTQDARVKRHAMQWLGRLKEPAGLEFIESLLK